MQILNVTTLPIYLPADKAAIPFGDPLSDISVTSSTTAVITAPGYVPVLNDAVQFSASINSSGTAGVLPGGITAATTYYVISPSTDTFSISTTKGGAAVATTSTGAGLLTLHLVSNQFWGTLGPFKPNNSCVALNLTGSSITLQGAADASAPVPGGTGVNNGGYGNPQGPGTWNTIATVASGTATLVTLSYDWIRATSAGTLVLLQN